MVTVRNVKAPGGSLVLSLGVSACVVGCWLVLRLAPRFEGARLGRVGAGIQFRGVGVGLGAAGSLPPVPW